MKYIKLSSLIILIIFIFALTLFSEEQSTGNMQGGIGRLSYIQGNVYIQRASELGYEEASINLPVVEGDRIGTSDGRAEVYLGRSNYLRLDYDTKIDFLSFPSEDYGKLSIKLWAGRTFLRVNNIYNEKEIEITTQNVTVYVLKEGLYRIDINYEGNTEVSVLDGLAEVSSYEGTYILRSNQKIETYNGKFTSRPFYITFVEDSFSDFNRTREEMIQARKYRRTYLPSELNDYEWEFDYYGRWHYLNPYGWVWTPVSVYYGWRPYYWGRWGWYPRWGWTWIPYEPWGWAAYHYGRWGWNLSLGWYWIPTPIWGPAWVYWGWGYDWIGWCPIDYWGYPVVIINNFYYRNYNNNIPSNSSAWTFIRKDQLQARDISKAVLSKDRIKQIGTVQVTKNQPDLKPVFGKVQAQPLKGKKVFLRNEPTISPEKGYESRTIEKRSSRRMEEFPASEKNAIDKNTFSRRKEIPETSRITREPKSDDSASVPSREKIIKKRDYKNEYPFSVFNDSRTKFRSRDRREREPENLRKYQPYSRSERKENKSSIREIFKSFSGGGTVKRGVSERGDGSSRGRITRDSRSSSSSSSSSRGSSGRSSSGGRKAVKKKD
ncbi:MAG: DUF6600 domain-containing protein [Acidobacteriota bacterium]